MAGTGVTQLNTASLIKDAEALGSGPRRDHGGGFDKLNPV
jgi:hypothetical protein